MSVLEKQYNLLVERGFKTSYGSNSMRKDYILHILEAIHYSVFLYSAKVHTLTPGSTNLRIIGRRRAFLPFITPRFKYYRSRSVIL